MQLNRDKKIGFVIIAQLLTGIAIFERAFAIIVLINKDHAKLYLI